MQVDVRMEDRSTMSPNDKKYVVVCYMRVAPEDIELLTLEEARKEVEHWKLLQPENLYMIEEIESEESDVVRKS